MNIVILDGDISYPATSGKRLRTLHLMTRLAERHRITYIARGDAQCADAHRAVEYLCDHHIEPILIHDPVPAKSGMMFYGKLLGNLFAAQPYSVASHVSRKMRQVVSEYAQNNSVDLWQLEWVPYLANMNPSHPAPKLAIAHNVDTLIWQRYAQTTSHPLKRWFLKNQWKKFATFERWAFHQVDRVVAVSEEDAEIMRNDFNVRTVDVVENGMDQAYFQQAVGDRRKNTILFLGALDWRPNTDAVDLLLTRIFPQVRRSMPDATLWIVGRNPSPGLAARCAEIDGVELHADVPDVRPFLAEASVMAVPLRIGGGSRLKILEALACGLPVVSTSVGAEGLRIVPGEHYIRAEKNDMAVSLVETLRDSARAITMAVDGRDFVRTEYDWSVLADKLENVWEKCRLRRSVPVMA